MKGAAPWGLLALPAAFLALFFYAPLAQVLAGGLSYERLSELLTDPYIQRLIRFTTWQALLSSLLSTAIGIPMAYILARREFPGRNVLSALTIVPFVLPSITVALGFLLMFGQNGWFNQGLFALTGSKVQILHSMWAILLAHAFYNAPVVARTTQAAWEQLDPSLVESARSLGAGPFAVWRDVTLPGILPAVAGGAALAFIYAFLSFPIVLALGGARYSTLEVEIYTQIRVLWDREMGAALAAIQAVISLLFAYVLLRLQGQKALFAARRAEGPRQALFAMKGSAWRSVPLWIFIAAALLLFLGPMLSIVVDSFKDPRHGYSLSAYVRLLTAGHDAFVGNAPLTAIGNSLRFGFWSALISLSAGVVFTFCLVRGFRTRRPFLETLALAPIAVSSIALAYGFLVAFRRPPLDVFGPDWRIILIHSVLSFPFVVRAFRPVLENVDRRLGEAARSLGAHPVRAFFDVELPLVARGVFVAFAFAFGLSVAEMSATMMLASPGLVTMPVGVYRFLAARDFQAASAMAVLLILVAAGVFLVLEIAARAVGREQRAKRRVAGRRTSDRGLRV